MTRIDHKSSQFLEPLFEYSGACAGCGETPYLKMLTQLFGDRLLIANATGCSSIYGGNLPTTPYTTNRDGRGPAWSNSLFEDNAEFGFGFRLALDAHVAARARPGPAARAADRRRPRHGAARRRSVERGRHRGAARARRRRCARSWPGVESAEARRLETLADYLVKKSVWLVGGDGWAYDIGYGGLDHVLANRRDVNILVLDTEVYSNTGGQASKATPLGAAAKFAAAGKPVGKKDLGLLANMYGHVYVAKVAFGAKMAQTAQAFLEAESYHGPSLIIAYSHCIAHGYDMAHGASQQKLAVDSGVWPLYRFDPRRLVKGEPPLHLDYGPPKAKVADYMRNESRFRMVERADPARYKKFVAESQAAAERRYAVYQQLAGITVPVDSTRRSRQHAARPTRRRSDGSQHHVPRDAPAASADRRRRTARRRPGHGPRRSKTPARRCWCCARCTKRKSPASRWTRSSTSRATPTRSPRRAASAPEPMLALGPDEYLEHLRPIKDAVRIPVIASLNGVTPGGWISLRAAARASRRRRPRAAHLSRRQRHDDERGRRRTPGHRHRARGQAQRPHPGRRQARAAAHRVRPLRASSSTPRAPTGSCCSRASTASTSTSTELEVVRTLPLSDSSELPLRLRGTAALAGRVKASLAITGGVHTALDVIKATMAGAHATQMVSALLRHGPGHLRRSAARSSRGCRSTSGRSLNEMRGNMSFERIPDPAAYERANFRMALR